MSSMSIEESLLIKLAKTLSNPLFPALDSQLRPGRHIGISALKNWIIMPFWWVSRRNCRASTSATMWSGCARRKGSFIAPAFYHFNTAFGVIGAEYDGQRNPLLFVLSPEWLAYECIFSQQKLYDELLSMADENKLLKLVN